MRDSSKPLDRRAILAGAGTAGALAAAATLLPDGRHTAPVVQASAQPTGDDASGYRLTEHVKRYYATTRI